MPQNSGEYGFPGYDTSESWSRKTDNYGNFSESDRMDVDYREIRTEYDGYHTYAMSNSVGALIVWWIVIFVVTILALYALKPTFVLKKGTNDVDNGKVIISSFIIAILIVLLIWVITAFSRNKRYSTQ